MTNAEIIRRAAQELAEAGIINYTGNEITIEDENGETITFKETEPIHTFAKWKSLGYCVRKGEHAKAKLRIWKFTASKKNQKDDEEDSGEHAFMKTAFFFTPAQVEWIGEPEEIPA